MRTSLGPERVGWIDRCRAPRGEEAREERAGGEHRGDGGERRHVPRVHPEQQPAHQPSGAERARESRRDSDRRQPARLAQHEAIDAAPLGAERHAHADLARPLPDRVGDHPVQADDARARSASTANPPTSQADDRCRYAAGDRSIRSLIVCPPSVTMSRSTWRMVDVIAPTSGCSAMVVRTTSEK